MNVIKNLDFFGVKFHFYVNNHQSYKNAFGGIMSIIYFLICISLFFIYNLDEIKRKNPISTISEFPLASQKLINLQKEKIWIPFRIATDENKYIDHRNILKINPSLVVGEFNREKGMLLKDFNLSYKLCNETSMANKPDYYFIDIPLNELYCIEQDNIAFGGDWNGNIKYLEISLYLCNGVSYNMSDPKCSGLTKLMETINSSLCFDLYFPVVQFQPTNLKNPISIIYKNYFYRLSAYSYKLQKLYIKEHIFSDDLNIVKSELKNKSFWGFNSFYGDSYSFPDRIDPLIKDKDQKALTLEIYMDPGIILYSRSFKKLFELISDVFPFFTLIFYLFRYFTYYIKISLIKRKLAECIFERVELKPKPTLVRKFQYFKRPHYSDKNHLNLKFDTNVDKRFLRKSSQLSNQKNDNKLSSSNNQSKSHIGLEEDNIIKILNKKEISTLSKNNYNEALYKPQRKISSSSNNKKVVKKKSNKHIFPLSYFLMDFILDKFNRPKQLFCINKLYFSVFNYMCRIFDISTHIALIKQFKLNNNLLSRLFSKENGMNQNKFYDKINLNEENIIDKINNDLIENKSFLFE